MITVIIDLSEDLPMDRRKAYIEEIEENFPFNYTDNEVAHSYYEEPQIMIQLAQEEMTMEQEKYLNKFEYVREYNVRLGTLQPKTALDAWQIEAFHEIIENPVNKVPSNGNHTRFYTEACHERQWDARHHLIDIEGVEPMYADLTITQCASDGATQVTLNCNEVDELLTILLQWRMNAAKASHKALTKVNDDNLSSADEHPF